MLITIATPHCTMLAKNILQSRPEHGPAGERAGFDTLTVIACR